MPRSLWKGAISFGLVNVPVELHSAEMSGSNRSGGLDLTMLDRRDMSPVGFRRFNKATGEEVPHLFIEAITQAYMASQRRDRK